MVVEKADDVRKRGKGGARGDRWSTDVQTHASMERTRLLLRCQAAGLQQPNNY